MFVEDLRTRTGLGLVLGRPCDLADAALGRGSFFLVPLQRSCCTSGAQSAGAGRR